MNPMQRGLRNGRRGDAEKISDQKIGRKSRRPHTLLRFKMAAAAIYSVMTGDIHDYKMRVESVLRTLGGENFPEEDEASIRSFVEHLRVKNLSDGRIAKYIFALIVFRRHLTCNFREAARPEIEKAVLWLNSHDYTPKTRADMKVLLRIFYRWVRHGNTDKKTPYPPEVAWIETGLKPSEDTLPVYLTEGEVKSMIDNAPIPEG
jgi:hypothetical protein